MFALERLFIMELFRGAHFDFLVRKWWFILPSLILLLAGFASIVARGGPLYSIDFKGGAQMEVRWEGAPPVERIRAARILNAQSSALLCISDERLHPLSQPRSETRCHNLLPKRV